LTYDDAVVELIASRCTEVESGGRMVDAILTQTLLPEMSRELLSQMIAEAALRTVNIRVTESKFEYLFES
jgi:type VI secretion system protein VasG